MSEDAQNASSSKGASQVPEALGAPGVPGRLPLRNSEQAGPGGPSRDSATAELVDPLEVPPEMPFELQDAEAERKDEGCSAKPGRQTNTPYTASLETW